MAAQYPDEDDIWKCPKHPSRRRRIGICHVCLREQLASLCPNCATTQPCACYLTSFAASTPSPSIQSSSFSFNFSRLSSSARPSPFIEIEPSFHRSRSVAVKSTPSKSTSLWSIFKGGSGSRSKRVEAEGFKAVLPPLPESKARGFLSEEEGTRRTMSKSRSVAAPVGSDWADFGSRSGRAKVPSGWYFPSPIKALKLSISRHSSIQESSPLHRS